MLRCCAAVPQIAVGYNHSIAVANDGGVWTWGNGGYGRLGHKVQQVRYGERGSRVPPLPRPQRVDLARNEAFLGPRLPPTSHWHCAPHTHPAG